MRPTTGSRRWTGGCSAAPAPSSGSWARSPSAGAAADCVPAPTRRDPIAAFLPSFLFHPQETIMTEHTTHEEVRALRADRQHIAALIGRYPRISDREAQEIVTFLRTGRHL